MQSDKNRVKKTERGSSFLKTAAAVLFAASVIFASLALYENFQLRSEEEIFSQLAEKIEKEPQPVQNGGSSGGNAAEASKYAELAKENADMFGWIKIDGTPVNYPVMYTPEEPEKYLRRSFFGEYSIAGCIFLDARCTPDSSNLIVYGHRMDNETMFGSLLNYRDKKYFEQHPIIHFDTLYEKRDYEIIAVFNDKVHDAEENGFRYYNFIEADSLEDFNRALDYFKENALYDTGRTAEFGNQLLTLSTCSHHEKDGRFVVVAKRLSVG